MCDAFDRKRVRLLWDGGRERSLLYETTLSRNIKLCSIYIENLVINPIFIGFKKIRNTSKNIHQNDFIS